MRGHFQLQAIHSLLPPHEAVRLGTALKSAEKKNSTGYALRRGCSGDLSRPNIMGIRQPGEGVYEGRGELGPFASSAWIMIQLSPALPFCTQTGHG